MSKSSREWPDLDVAQDGAKANSLTYGIAAAQAVQ
jgi:hypothetical protein